MATGTWKLPDLLTEVDANGDGTLTVAEVEGWLKVEANRNVLRKVVVNQNNGGGLWGPPPSADPFQGRAGEWAGG